MTWFRNENKSTQCILKNGLYVIIEILENSLEDGGRNVGKEELKDGESLSNDRRAVRSRKMIKEAFYRLLEKKSLHEISITDITEEADINRGTFYLHYVDKYDLLNKLEDEILESLISYAKDTIFDGVFELDSENHITAINKPIPFVKKLFDFLKENRVLVRAVSGPNGDPNFQQKIKGFMAKTLFENRFVLNIKMENMLVPQEYFVSYVISAHMGVALQWLEGDMKRSSEEMALILTKLFVLGPFRVTGVNAKEDLRFMNK